MKTSLKDCLPCLVIAGILLLNAACSDKDDPSLPEPEFIVRLLIAPSGLGDLSYNDNILRGVLEEQKEHSFQLEYAVPEDKKEAEQILRRWQADGDSPHHFTILAASGYEGLARRCLSSVSTRNYLLFDTRADDLPISTFHFTGYGVSFLAGIAAYTQTKAEKAVYLGGQQHETYIEDCYYGFRDGYLYAGGKEVVETYLSTAEGGFAMPHRAYEMADSLYRLYPFIYAMAGKSNTGIYHYLRENPGNGYTAGVDTDQSMYSDRIIGSMIKDIGGCIRRYIAMWMNGEELPARKFYTLESGYTSFQIADTYKAGLEKTLSASLPIAIQKEKEYESNKP